MDEENWGCPFSQVLREPRAGRFAAPQPKRPIGPHKAKQALLALPPVLTFLFPLSILTSIVKWGPEIFHSFVQITRMGTLSCV